MSRKPKQKPLHTITPMYIENVLDRAPGQWFSRSQIAYMLGRKKTSHVIRMIEQAVEEGRLLKEMGTDQSGRPTYGYTVNPLPF